MLENPRWLDKITLPRPGVSEMIRAWIFLTFRILPSSPVTVALAQRVVPPGVPKQRSPDASPVWRNRSL